MKLFLNWKMRFAFGFAMMAMLLMGFVAYRWMVVSDVSNGWVLHTHDVLMNIQDMRLAMKTAQTSSLDFALTGNDADIGFYHESVSRVVRDEATVRNLTVDNTVQQNRLPTLEALAAENFRRTAAMIALRQDKGLAVVAAMSNGTIQQSAVAFEDEACKLRQEEIRLRELRSAATQTYMGQVKLMLIFGTCLGMLFVGMAAWSVENEISRRAQADAALRESEERLRFLFDGVRDHAIYMLDTEGRVVSWNAGAERIKGYAAKEIIGQKFSRFYPQDDIDGGRPKEILRIAADSGHFEESAMLVRKDGTEFLAGVSNSALRDPEGNLRGFSVICQDLTAKQQSEARYRGLLEAAPDAMVVVNELGEIVLLNAQSEKQFGYLRNELIGRKVKSIIPEGFAERLIADGTRTAAEALAQHIGTGIELNGLRKDGSEFPIEIMLSPLESVEGILVTAAIRDITTRKDAEAQLVQKVKELNRSNEELEQFAYVASHDLQEPLRMVASYTQLLSRRYKGKLDSDADEFIAFAVDGANRMQRLIQDLLTFSRVGKKGQDLVDVSSEEALQHAVLNLRGAIEESGALVTHGPMPEVRANELQLTQLFQNLVGNAIKYQGSGIPHIHISAAKNGAPKWIFSVKDDGLGIDPQFFERIFGMFQRLHKRDEFAGTGMGLAICKKIVERHGGSISVESTPGNGSTFQFTLPQSEKKS